MHGAGLFSNAGALLTNCGYGVLSSSRAAMGEFVVTFNYLPTGASADRFIVFPAVYGAAATDGFTINFARGLDGSNRAQVTVYIYDNNGGAKADAPFSLAILGL